MCNMCKGSWMVPAFSITSSSSQRAFERVKGDIGYEWAAPFDDPAAHLVNADFLPEDEWPSVSWVELQVLNSHHEQPSSDWKLTEKAKCELRLRH